MRRTACRHRTTSLLLRSETFPALIESSNGPTDFPFAMFKESADCFEAILWHRNAQARRVLRRRAWEMTYNCSKEKKSTQGRNAGICLIDPMWQL